MDSNIRIAFITPEAPPFSGGGIATFIRNIAKGLHGDGIFCEVFAPAISEESTIEELDGVLYHRISTLSLSSFMEDVVSYFVKRHEEKKFTIIESCEIHASLYELMKYKLPGLQYGIRVQMPAVLQAWLNHYYESRWLKLRYVLGAFRRGRWDLGFWNKTDVKRKRDKEFLVCEMAGYIIAPSVSFKEWLIDFWCLPGAKIEVIPHLFDFATLAPPEPKETAFPKNEFITVLFVGKLNAHKGVINLAKAARRILRSRQDVQFVFIGEDWPIRYKLKSTMTGMVIRDLTGGGQRIHLMGKVPYSKLYGYLRAADICVLPSLWEAWGYTCTEAMSMGKPVIGSKYGGMADAIEHGVNGLLVDSFSVDDIENKLEMLIRDENMRERLGKAAADTVRNKLNFQKLVKENITFYNNLLNS